MYKNCVQKFKRAFSKKILNLKLLFGWTLHIWDERYTNLFDWNNSLKNHPFQILASQIVHAVVVKSGTKWRQRHIFSLISTDLDIKKNKIMFLSCSEDMPATSPSPNTHTHTQICWRNEISIFYAPKVYSRDQVASSVSSLLIMESSLSAEKSSMVRVASIPSSSHRPSATPSRWSATDHVTCMSLIWNNKTLFTFFTCCCTHKLTWWSLKHAWISV